MTGSAREVIDAVLADAHFQGLAPSVRPVSLIAALERAGFAIVPVEPMETAPEDGTEIVVYRPDAGWFMAHFMPPAVIMPEDELLTEEQFHKSIWFTTLGEDISGDLPTHWLNLCDVEAMLSTARQQGADDA